MTKASAPLDGGETHEAKEEERLGPVTLHAIEVARHRPVIVHSTEMLRCFLWLTS